MKREKLTREEKKEARDKQFIGTGHYIYENKTQGFLTLPKPAIDGRKVVPPGGTFEGDSYFMQLVKQPNNLLKFLGEKKVEDKKLILDQPDTVTVKGTVEHVVNDDSLQKINDSVNNKKSQDVLLNEGPMDGVEII